VVIDVGNEEGFMGPSSVYVFGVCIGKHMESLAHLAKKTCQIQVYIRRAYIKPLHVGQYIELYAEPPYIEWSSPQPSS